MLFLLLSLYIKLVFRIFSFPLLHIHFIYSAINGIFVTFWSRTNNQANSFCSVFCNTTLICIIGTEKIFSLSITFIVVFTSNKECLNSLNYQLYFKQLIRLDFKKITKVRLCLLYPFCCQKKIYLFRFSTWLLFAGLTMYSTIAMSKSNIWPLFAIIKYFMRFFVGS